MTPLVRMVIVIAVTFIAMKTITLAVARVSLAPVSLLEFFGWPGMRPALFERKRVVDRAGARALALHGLACLALGAALFAIARAIAYPLWSTILALPALSLMLHFGVFDLLAAIYRLRGVPVAKLFRAPLFARSLSEFWSRRWNIGFSEMVATVVHRPLRPVIGENGALLASFLLSGVLHELAISVPVNAGYGLPTLYFLLHGALVAIERKVGRPLGRVWTLFWLAAPMPLVFHPPFVHGIIWPLLGLT
ncbi:MAG TPA: membrane bound O-acyl transferase family-domain-containing protein [Thermoanaerobaculia bacterium]|nr:membrane bound O-acyl transferase family-domain-containing protein [Thermoanaerobaculia bacterium]